MEAGKIQDEIDGRTASIPSAGREIDRLAQEKTGIDATQGAGGYAANEITPPGEGGQVAPVLLQSILMGLAIGLVLGGLGVLVAEMTDKSFKSPAEIRKRLGLPVIGHIPQIRMDCPVRRRRPGRPRPGAGGGAAAEVGRGRGVPRRAHATVLHDPGPRPPGHPGHQPEPRRRQVHPGRQPGRLHRPVRQAGGPHRLRLPQAAGPQDLRPAVHRRDRAGRRSSPARPRS